MTLQRKTSPFTVEAGTRPGSFHALAAVFGNVDRTGDRIVKGAFKDTIYQWRRSGKKLPIIVAHDWTNPFAVVGSAHPEDIFETDEGLEVTGTLDVDDNPTAKQVHKLLTDGRLSAWSFGYHVKKDRQAGKGVTELLELDLHEVGPCLVGANPEARTLAVKSALGDHAGRYRLKSLAELRALVDQATDTQTKSTRPEFTVVEFEVA